MMNRATTDSSSSAGSCYQFLDLSDAGECDAATLRGLLYPSSAPSTATDSRPVDGDDGSVSVSANTADARTDNVAHTVPVVEQCPEVVGGPGTASVEQQHPKSMGMKLLLPPTGNPIALNPNAQSFDPMLMMVVVPGQDTGPPGPPGVEPLLPPPPTVTNSDRHRMISPFTKSISNGRMMLPAPPGPLVTMVLPPGADHLVRPPVTLPEPPKSQDHQPASGTTALPPPPPLPALLPTPSLSVLAIVKPPTATVQAKQQQHQLPSSPSSVIFQSTIGAVPTAPTAPPAALPATPVNETTHHSSSFVVNSGGLVGDEPWIAHSDQRKTSGGGAVAAAAAAAAEEVATRTCVVTSAATMPPLTNNALQQPPPPSQQQQQQQQPPPSNQQQPPQQGHNVIVPSGRGGTGSATGAGSGAGDGRMISGGGGGAGGVSDGGRNADRENANNQQLQSISVSNHHQQQQMVPHVYQPIPAYMQPGPHGMYPVPMVPQTVPNNNVYVSNLTANVNVHGYMSHPMSPYMTTGAQYLPAEVSSGQEIQLLQTAPIMQPSRGTMRRGGRNNRGGNNSRSRGGYVPHFIQQQQQQQHQHQQQQQQQQQHHHFHQSQVGGAGMQTLVHHQGGQSAQALQSQQQQQQGGPGGGGNGGQQQTPPTSSGGGQSQQQQGPHHPPPQHTPELIHMDAPMMGGAGQYGGYGYLIPVMPSQHHAAQHATGTPLFMNTPQMAMFYPPSMHGYPSGYPFQVVYPSQEYPPMYDDKGDDQQQQQHGGGGGPGSHEEAGMHAVAEGHPGMWAGPPMTVEYHTMEQCEYLQGHEDDGSGGGALMQGGPPPPQPPQGTGMPPQAATGMTHHHHVLDPNVPGFTMQMQAPDEFLALQGPPPPPPSQQNGANGMPGEDYNVLNNNTIITAIAGTNTSSNTGEGAILEHPPPPVTMSGDVPSLPQHNVVHTQAGEMVMGEGGSAGYLLAPHQQQQQQQQLHQQQPPHQQQQHHQQQQANLMNAAVSVEGAELVLVDQQQCQQQADGGGSLNNNFIVDQQYIQSHPPPHLTPNPAVIHHAPPPVPQQQPQEPIVVLHQHQPAQEIPMNLTEPPPPANNQQQQQQPLPPFNHTVAMHAQQQPPTQAPQLVQPAPNASADVVDPQPVMVEAGASDTNNNSSKPGDAVVMTKLSTITPQQPSIVNTGTTTHNHNSKATNAHQQHASQQQHQQTSTAMAGHVPNPKVTQRQQHQQTAPQSSQPHHNISGYAEVTKGGVHERMENLSLKDDRRPSSYAAAATEGTQGRPPAAAPSQQSSQHAPNAGGGGGGVWANSGHVGTGGVSKKSTASVSVSAIPNKEFSNRSKNTSHATAAELSTATGAASNVSQQTSSSTGFRQSSAGSAGQKTMANAVSNDSAVHHHHHQHQRHANAASSIGSSTTGQASGTTMGGIAASAPLPPQMESKKVEAIPQRTVSTTAVASNSSMSGATAIEAGSGGKTGHGHQQHQQHHQQQQQQQQQRDVVIVPTATNTVKSAAKPAAITINHPLNVPPPAHHPLNIPPPIIVPPPQIPTTAAAAPPQPNKTWASLFNSSSSSSASPSANAVAASMASSNVSSTTPVLPTAAAPGLGAAARSTTPSSSSVSSTHHQATVATPVTQQQQQHHQHHHHPAASAVPPSDRTASQPSAAVNFAPPISRSSVSGGQTTAAATVAATHTNVTSTAASSSSTIVVTTAASTPKNLSNDGVGSTGNAKKPVAKVQPYERNHMTTPGVMSYSSAAASTPGGNTATSNAASSTGSLPRGGAAGNAKGSTGGGSSDKKGGGSSSNATASITDQKDEFSLKFGDFLSGYHIENSSISIVPRGLINRSNYCYINTILQALVACPPFYHLMRTIRTLPAAKNAKHPKPFIDAMCSLVGEFSQLPMRSKMPREKGKKDDTPEISVDPPFEPVVIHKILNGVRSDIFQIEGRQEDAEEFLGCVLNRLNDEMIEFMKLNKPEQSVVNGEEPTNGEAHGEEDDDWMVICGNRNKGTVTRTTDFGRSPISDIFGGKLRSRVQRDGVPPTYNIQPFFTLQLDIEKAASVKEALEQLVGRDELEGVTCTKTKQEVAAWQQVTLEELPVVLILHLKCFDYKMDGCTKILKTLDFPIELKIDSKLLSSKGKSYTAKQKQYKLFAVVYHDGKEASKGHYITDVFHGGYGSWIRYDDSTVKPMTEYNVLRPRAPRVPYLLYYRRMDTHYHGTNSDGGGGGGGSHHHRGSGGGGGDGGSGNSGGGRGGSAHSSTGGDRHNSHHHHYNNDHGRGSGGYGSGSGGGGNSGAGHGGSSYGSGGNHYGSGGGGGYGHSNSSQYGK
ncbi:nuclear receptor coactivator 6 isoform X1 [Anopheles aquasalis]|uniref:nuclear receptor coactivator 6 isoform X1 n=2 Tax=Anopheles aquasalis TaxID=42839 RepID=UPI00215A6A5A|nr:nuclear receptor coactivator 6 isoform X1 [Anopheles aquasalis]